MNRLEHDPTSLDLTQPQRSQQPESQSTTQDLPASIYASSIPPEIFQQDVRTIREGLAEGTPHSELSLNIVDRHWEGKSEPGATAAHVYASDLVENVSRHPEYSVEQHAVLMQPTQAERTRWEPLIEAVPVEVADSFQWAGSNGTVQSYRHESTLNYLHVDGPSGQFYDRDKAPISQEAALSRVLPQQGLQQQAQDLGVATRDKEATHALAI